jgi:hypothetical protein
MDVQFENIDIRKASPEERKGAITVFEDLTAGGMDIAFPIMKIGEETIIGYNEKKLRKVLKKSPRGSDQGPREVKSS